MPVYNTQKIIKYVGIAAIALLVVGLLGWYFFLRTQTRSIESTDAARGFGIAVPSFTGSRSSTSENVSGDGAESLLFVPQENTRPPRLWRVSQTPVAGAGFIGTSTTLRYVERPTGHVYDVDPAKGNITRRTNTLLPKIYDADVLRDGIVVLQVLNKDSVRETVLARMSTTTSEEGLASLEPVSLGTNVRAIATSPRNPEMLLVAAREDGGTELLRSTSDGDEPKSIMSLPLASLEPHWLSDGRIFVSERPASGVVGSAYEIVGTTMAPLLGGIPGLVVLPQSSTGALLYSSDDGTRLRFFVRPSRDASTVELALQTTAAKCVWAPVLGTTSPATAYCASSQNPLPAQFTDQWLRGLVHTQDEWVKLDLGAGKTDRFFMPETSVAIDVEHPIIDTRGEYIVFTNARDKSLWVLRINE
jgi:hypothetical protein